MVTEYTIRMVALEYLRVRSTRTREYDREFKAHFGTTTLVTTIIYNKLVEQLETRAEPKHLLMGLHFLACYPKDCVGANLFDVTEKTYRVWHWQVTKEIAALTGIIVWEDRKQGTQPGDVSNTYISVDGVDCRIPEPRPFDPEMMSHKIRHAAYKYELGISIRTGHICWVNGAVKAGLPDIELSRRRLLDMLEWLEKIIADKGYQDGFEFFITPLAGVPEFRDINHRMRRWSARHETANGRLKNFHGLQNFRCSRFKHGMCFMAVANIVQLNICNGFPLFDME